MRGVGHDTGGCNYGLMVNATACMRLTRLPTTLMVVRYDYYWIANIKHYENKPHERVGHTPK